MEGPLVSDTTEVLSGASPAPEEPPIGHPAAEPAGAAPRSSSRSGGGDLSKLLVSDLQRIAQELGISGTGRMRKGDLVAAIQFHRDKRAVLSADKIDLCQPDLK